LFECIYKKKNFLTKHIFYVAIAATLSYYQTNILKIFLFADNFVRFYHE